MGRILVKWKKSTIGKPATQRATIESLGLRRLNQEVIHEDSPSIRGMLFKIRHLIQVEEIK